MKKVTYYASAILALGLIAYFTLRQSQSTLNGRETRFAPDNVERINRIVVSGPQGEVEITLQNDTWMLGTGKANQERIAQTLLLASNLKVAAPVPLESEDSIARDLENGTRFDLYDGNKRLKSLQLCTHNHQLYGRLHHARHSYRLTITGYPQVDFTRLVEPSKTNWEDNLLFPFPATDIRSICLQYGTMPAKSFCIRVDDLQHPALQGNQGEIDAERTNPELLSQYLYSFDHIRYEPWLAPSFVPDTSDAFFTLKIETRSNTRYTLNGFLAINDSTGRPHQRVFIGSTTKNGLITLKFNDFDPLLLPVDYFLKNE